MGNLFVKKPKVTDVDRAILSLKTQRRKLADYQRRVEAVIEAEKEAAKKLIREKKKEKALLAIRKKRAHEELVKQVDTWLLNVEKLLTDIELSSRQKDVFESLKAGNNAIKTLQSEINLEDVEKLIDDTAEAKAYQDELNAILSHDDDNGVLADLIELEAALVTDEQIVEGLPVVPKVPVASTPNTENTKIHNLQGNQVIEELPNVPKFPVASTPINKDTEIDSLQANQVVEDLPDVPKNPVASSPTRKVLEEPLHA